jgi:hypothetical protein
MSLSENVAPNVAPCDGTAPFVPPIKFPQVSDAPQVLPLRAAGAGALGSLAGNGGPTPTETVDSSSSDALTPRLLEALASLDAETANLSALSTPRPRLDDDDAEPAWLTEAEHAAARTPPPDAPPAAGDAVAVGTLSRELYVVEEQCRHLRSSAEATAGTVKDVMTQLDLTRTAAEGTAAAARRIVDDHERTRSQPPARLPDLSTTRAAEHSHLLHRRQPRPHTALHMPCVRQVTWPFCWERCVL